MSEMAQELEEALDRLEDYLEVWLLENGQNLFDV